MTFRGQVKNGMVVFDTPLVLAEGTVVDVQVVVPNSPEAANSEPPTLYERFKPLIGVVQGLPADLAEQHDHYLYNTPKRP